MVNRLRQAAGEIRERLDIRDVAERYGLAFNRAGYARCPFHAEKTASFRVQNHVFAHCFGCGQNADAVKLVQQLLGLPRADAIRKLSADYGLRLDIGCPPTLKQSVDARRRLAQRKHDADLARQAELDAERRFFDRVMDEDRIKEILAERAPKRPTDELDDAFVAALKAKDAVSYAADLARAELADLGR